MHACANITFEKDRKKKISGTQDGSIYLWCVCREYIHDPNNIFLSFFLSFLSFFCKGEEEEAKLKAHWVVLRDVLCFALGFLVSLSLSRRRSPPSVPLSLSPIYYSVVVGGACCCCCAVVVVAAAALHWAVSLSHSLSVPHRSLLLLSPKAKQPKTCSTAKHSIA